jgi:hypothetical protein
MPDARWQAKAIGQAAKASIIPFTDYIDSTEAGIEGRQQINRECTSGEPNGEPKE